MCLTRWAAVLLLCLGVGATAQTGGRQRLSMDPEWCFALGDPAGAERPFPVGYPNGVDWHEPHHVGPDRLNPVQPSRHTSEITAARKVSYKDFIDRTMTNP